MITGIWIIRIRHWLLRWMAKLLIIYQQKLLIICQLLRTHIRNTSIFHTLLCLVVFLLSKTIVEILPILFQTFLFCFLFEIRVQVFISSRDISKLLLRMIQQEIIKLHLLRVFIWINSFEILTNCRIKLISFLYIEAPYHISVLFIHWLIFGVLSSIECFCLFSFQFSFTFCTQIQQFYCFFN